MNYTELVKQLRNTQSRSKRELLDAAADAIEELMTPYIKTNLNSLDITEEERERIFFGLNSPPPTLRPVEHDWIDPKEELPAAGMMVLIVCSGRSGNLGFHKAYQLAEYDPDEKDWILDAYPTVTGLTVHQWRELPGY